MRLVGNLDSLFLSCPEAEFAFHWRKAIWYYTIMHVAFDMIILLLVLLM